jgi:hypothetical protein
VNTAPAEERDRFAAAELAGEWVRRAAEAFAPEGIRVMPLKGVLLQKLVYREPARRALSDVDLLVPEPGYERATAALHALGFRVVRETERERELRDPRGGPPIDLHRALFSPGQFRMPASDLFARARRDNALFSAPVWVPDPHDLYAHLVGHLALTFLFVHRVHHPEDLGAVADRFGLDPIACAAHLRRCGIARAARYALALADEASPDAFARKVAAALGEDLPGELLARGVLAVVPQLRPFSTLGLLPRHVLHRTPASAARALARALERRVKRLIAR